jgi:hypothetical protein
MFFECLNGKDVEASGLRIFWGATTEFAWKERTKTTKIVKIFGGTVEILTRHVPTTRQRRCFRGGASLGAKGVKPHLILL